VVPQPLKPTVLPTPVTGIQPGTIIKYLVKKSEDLAISRGTHRVPRAQPTLLEQALGATGPNSQPSEVSTPRGHSPERVDWGGTGELYRSPTRPAMNEQPSGPSDLEDTSDDDDINRESGAQPTPPDETLGATGPDTPPVDALMLQG